MPEICKKGEIWRVGHTRKNTKNKKKKVFVPGKCIKATSQTGTKMSNISREKLEEKKIEHKIAREKYGIPKCKKGEIVKEGFKRKSKNGKETWVAPICVKDEGNKGKIKRLFLVEPGRLSKYGYNLVEDLSDLARHKALKMAFASGEKPLSVRRRLNALSVLTKNTQPMRSKIFKEDSEWIKYTNEYKLERAK